MITRSFLAAALLATSLWAGPPLTVIQDVLYKADGTLFNGSLTIGWTSFQAIDHSAIEQQQTTVVVVNGSLLVRLVPTTTATPAAYYTVVYNSDGRIQFTETWAVPSSVTPLRVSDVRIAAVGSSTAPGTAGADTGTVQESDVTGLIGDLGARPLKGPGYAAGRVAWANASGAIETVTGTPTDCVHVDGSSGPCGGVPPGYVDGETPAGVVDGSNTSFTLAGVPNPAASLTLYRNGVRQTAGVDYTLSASTISFATASTPQPGDVVGASYRLPGGGDRYAAVVSQSAGAVQRSGRGHEFERAFEHWRVHHPGGLFGGGGPRGDPLRFLPSGYGGRLHGRGSVGEHDGACAQRQPRGCAGSGPCGRWVDGDRGAVEQPIVGNVAELCGGPGEFDAGLHAGNYGEFPGADGAQCRDGDAKQFHGDAVPIGGTGWARPAIKFVFLHYFEQFIHLISVYLLNSYGYTAAHLVCGSVFASPEVLP